MPTYTLPEPDLHWTDHYAKYGFAVVRGLVDRAFTDEALAEAKRYVGLDKPLHEWTSDEVTPIMQEKGRAAVENPVFRRVYDQPRVRAAIDEMFGGPGVFNGARAFQLFVNAFNPAAERKIGNRGHIDFTNCPVPIFGSGFMFQVALLKTEPFNGNITIWPGTHKVIQKLLMDNPDWQWPQRAADIPESEPFEFVAEPGDTLFFHHLVYHNGNPNASSARTPRIALHCQAARDAWLKEVDPSKPNLSPWERSLAQNGAYRVTWDEHEKRNKFYAERARKAGDPQAGLRDLAKTY